MSDIVLIALISAIVALSASLPASYLQLRKWKAESDAALAERQKKQFEGIAQLEILKGEVARLNQRVSMLEAEKILLTTRVEHLEAENEALRRENNILRAGRDDE